MAGILTRSFSPESSKRAIFGSVISLVDNFDEPEPNEPGTPCTAEDIEFWTDVFGALLPAEEESSDQAD